MSTLADRDFERILIIKPSSFGDVLHGLPVLSALRRRYPGAHIAWLVGSPYRGLIEGHANLDEVIPFDRRRFSRVGWSPAVTAAFVRFARDLRRRRFDLTVDLQGLFRSGFLSWATGARARIGFRSARELGWVFYTHRLAIPDMETHAVDRNLLVGRVLGLADEPARFDPPIHSNAVASVQAKLREAGLAAGEPYATVIPGTRWETKHWPADRFARITHALKSRFSLRTVLLGTPDEVSLAEQVAAGGPPETINLVGRTNVAELTALIHEARLVLCNDSGPMHLASALRRPLVALFGPTNPVRTGPYAMPGSVVSLDLPCAPCYLKWIRQCPYDHRCLADLSVDRVLEAVQGVLDEPRAGRANPSQADSPIGNE